MASDFLIDHWLKAPAATDTYVNATLTRPVVSGLKYQEFVRVRMGCVGGRLMASPLSRGSGVVSSFMKADGILEVPQGLEGYEAGEEVSVRLLSPLEKLHNTLVVIGSHDPLLDELADMLHLEDSALYISSSHVGSMGGIMAIRRGEAHMAGCHLLDTADGSYNKAFIRKYFPKGGVKLVSCVGRQQGLMVAKGNPLQIRKFADIAKGGVRYVNRQKGSGTRILADYLCMRENVDTASVYGYDREELTHTSVAAQIASGSVEFSSYPPFDIYVAGTGRPDGLACTHLILPRTGYRWLEDAPRAQFHGPADICLRAGASVTIKEGNKWF